MKQRNFLLLMLILIFCNYAFSHKVYITPFQDLIKNAESIAIVKVLSIKTDESRCTTKTTVKLHIKKVIHGKYPGPKKINFYQVHYYWKKAKYFWQKDCPSTHYSTPVMPRKLKKGDTAIAVINKWKYGKNRLAVMGLIAYKKLSKVRDLIKIK